MAIPTTSTTPQAIDNSPVAVEFQDTEGESLTVVTREQTVGDVLITGFTLYTQLPPGLTFGLRTSEWSSQSVMAPDTSLTEVKLAASILESPRAPRHRMEFAAKATSASVVRMAVRTPVGTTGWGIGDKGCG